MINNQFVDLKVCGITTSDSIITAANNNIKSLGFASNNPSFKNATVLSKCIKL